MTVEVKNRAAERKHRLFSSLPIQEKCTWYGTTWAGKILLPCGEPTVGAGLFCDHSHQLCEYHSVCERHKQKLQTWDDEELK